MIDVPITTERLTIRRFEPRDLDAYLRFMLDEDSTRFFAFTPEQKTEKGAKALFRFVLQAYDTHDAVHAYAIADKETGEYLGSCGYGPYEDGVVECYYWLNRENRGRGLATEALRALLEALARENEVRTYCDVENPAARRVAESCGMAHAGFGRNKNTGLEGELFVYSRT